MKTNFKSRGFTLIELLVVVSIIVILTGIILNSLSGSRAKARDAQRISDLSQIQLALSLFVDRCGYYPNVATLQKTSTWSATVSGITYTCPTNTSTGQPYQLGDFINPIPTPPAGTGATNYDYTYYRLNPSKNVTNYVLHTQLESSNAAVLKGLPASSIYDPTSALNPAPFGWSLRGDQPPFSNCDNSATSIHYCISTN